jgi:hypothetical protein
MGNRAMGEVLLDPSEPVLGLRGCGVSTPPFLKMGDDGDGDATILCLLVNGMSNRCASKREKLN